MSETVVKVSDVRPDPKQPRKYFKAVALKALARSLELVGQRQPIEVKRVNGGAHKYEIIDGERRWRAHQIAGIATIRVSVTEGEIDPRRQHLLSTISNFHREGHTHTEISDALQYQRDLGETVAALAENLAKSEGWVYQYLTLQKLAPKLREKMHPETDDEQMLRFAEAVVLGSIPTAKQEALYREALDYARGERLAFYRKRCAIVQGKERIGRQMRTKEREQRFDNYVKSLCRYMDVALELKERDFETMLLAAEPVHLTGLEERLTKLRGDIGIMLVAIERAAKKLKVAA